MTVQRFALLLLLCLPLYSAKVLALTVAKIEFEGNRVTRESVLRQELLLREGDEADAARITASELAIMNLGLFKSVTSRLDEVGGETHLVFVMEERYFILPIPLVGIEAKDGNAAEGVGSYNLGLELRHDNVAGLNHRLKLIYEDKESPDGEVPYSTKIAIEYVVPRLIKTPYRFEVGAEQLRDEVLEREADMVVGTFDRVTNSGRLYLSRWLREQGISRGWAVGGGFSARENLYTNKTGTATEYGDDLLLTVNADLKYTDVQEYPYNRKGETYGYAISVASPPLGSEYSYTRHVLFVRRYMPLSITDSNLNTQIKLGISNGRGSEFVLDNSELLRGYERDYAIGNTMLLMNAEYHQHLSGYRQLRGVVFVDAGNAWQTEDSALPEHLHLGVGVGLRWRVQSFVDVTLRMDYGYGISSGTEQLTLTTSSSF